MFVRFVFQLSLFAEVLALSRNLNSSVFPTVAVKVVLDIIAADLSKLVAFLFHYSNEH